MTSEDRADSGDGIGRRTVLRSSALSAGWLGTGTRRVDASDDARMAAAERRQERDITGFHPPQIDGLPYGHGGEPLPEGKTGEWMDANVETVPLVSGGSGPELEAERFIKAVGSDLYLGIRVPAEQSQEVDSLSATQLSRFRLYVDRSGSAELSEGDVRLVGEPVTAGEEGGDRGIQSVEWQLERYQDGEFVNRPDIFEEDAPPTSMMARDTEDGGFSIESRVDTGALDELFDEDSEDQEEFNLNADFLSGDLSYGLNYDPTEIPPDYELGGGYRPGQIPNFDIDRSDVDRIEVTQSVQDDQNDLPLVQGKETLARVFVDHSESNATEVDVTLEALEQTGGSPAWQTIGTRSKTASVPPAPHDREEYDDSVNFELPASWRSTERLILAAKVSRPDAVRIDKSKGSDSTYVILAKTDDPKIFFGRVDGPNGKVGSRSAKLHKDAFRRLMPLANPKFVTFYSPLIRNVAGSDNLLSRLDRIATHLKTTNYTPVDQVFGLTAAYPGRGGLSSPSWGGGPNNHLAAWGDDAFSAGGASSSMDHVLSHEIDHNIGAKKWAYHLGSPCGSSNDDTNYSGWQTDEVGWSPAYNRMIPAGHPELMGYCNTRRSGYSGPNRPWKWISGYRWEHLYDRFRNWQAGEPKHSDYGGPVPSIGGAPIPPTPDRYYASSDPSPGQVATEADAGRTTQASTARVISGFLYPDGSGELLPSFAFPGETEVPPNDLESADTILEVEYAEGTTRVGLSASFEPIEGEAFEESGFSVALPEDSEARAIRLLDAETEEPLDSFDSTGFEIQDASLEVPQSVERGEDYEIGVNVEAQSESTLHRQLLFSTNGEDWLPYSEVFTENSRTVQFVDGPGGESARFLLLVGDGVRSRQFESETFTVPPRPPDVRIDRAQRLVIEGEQSGDAPDDGTGNEVAPVDGEIRNAAGPVETVVGATVSLQARGLTEHGEEITGSDLEWTIETEDGASVEALGAAIGGQLLHRFGRPGTYTVQVTGTDPQSGLTATDEIDVEVSPPPLPSVEAVRAFGKEVPDEQIGGEEGSEDDTDGTDGDADSGDGTGDTDTGNGTGGNTTSPADDTPGFGVVGALGTLATAGYLLSERLLGGESED